MFKKRLRMTLLHVQQFHLCFLAAILLLFCSNAGNAVPTAYEDKDVDVPVNWQQEKYSNDNTEKVTREITYTTGIKERKSNTKTIEATHTVGVLIKGEYFLIVNLSFELKYKFAHRTETVTMLETEIYGSRLIKTTVTIPPKSTLTRWELIADVAGAKIAYSLNIDSLNDTQSAPETNVSRVKVQVPRRINYGQTRIRLKHFDRKEYVTVARGLNNVPAATLGYSTRYLFILCQDSLGIQIKTLNTTYPGYVWAYPSSSGGEVYFDLSRHGENLRVSEAYTHHWLISKEDPLHDGDVVTFKNKYYDGSAICYYSNYLETNVYCLKGLEDRWILEIVDEDDLPGNDCATGRGTPAPQPSFL